MNATASDAPVGAVIAAFTVNRAFGPVVEGEALVSEEGFSPRYDLNRWTGMITKPGHKLEGQSIRDRICFFPTAKGGIAAFVFGVTNPVMVQGAIFAGITITEGWSQPAGQVIANGDWVRVDPKRKVVEVLRRGVAANSG